MPEYTEVMAIKAKGKQLPSSTHEFTRKHYRSDSTSRCYTPKRTGEVVEVSSLVLFEKMGDTFHIPIVVCANARLRSPITNLCFRGSENLLTLHQKPLGNRLDKLLLEVLMESQPVGDVQRRPMTVLDSPCRPCCRQNSRELLSNAGKMAWILGGSALAGKTGATGKT